MFVIESQIDSQLRQSLILLHHVWSSMWSVVPERSKIKTVLCKGWGICTDIYLHCPLRASVMKLWEIWDGKLHQVFFHTVFPLNYISVCISLRKMLYYVGRTFFFLSDVNNIFIFVCRPLELWHYLQCNVVHDSWWECTQVFLFF